MRCEVGLEMFGFMLISDKIVDMSGLKFADVDNPSYSLSFLSRNHDKKCFPSHPNNTQHYNPICQ